MTRTLAEWTEAAQVIAAPRQLLIDGELTEARSGERFPAVNPATGETITQVALGDTADSMPP